MVNHPFILIQKKPISTFDPTGTKIEAHLFFFPVRSNNGVDNMGKPFPKTMNFPSLSKAKVISQDCQNHEVTLAC